MRLKKRLTSLSQIRYDNRHQAVLSVPGNPAVSVKIHQLVVTENCGQQCGHSFPVESTVLNSVSFTNEKLCIADAWPQNFFITERKCMNELQHSIICIHVWFKGGIYPCGGGCEQRPSGVSDGGIPFVGGEGGGRTGAHGDPQFRPGFSGKKDGHQPGAGNDEEAGGGL